MTILFLSHSDTDLLTLRSVVDGLPEAFPAVRAANPSALREPPSLEGVSVVLVRLLGGRRAWDGFEALRAACVADRILLLAFAGEVVPDAELTRLSTVPIATAATAFQYLAAGGLDNMANLLRFVADEVLDGDWGFAPPVEIPASGRWGSWHRTPGRPVVGVVFYRAHVLSGNTLFVDQLCEAIEARGVDALPVYCYSLRADSEGRVEALELLAEAGVDAVITTVLAMGTASGDDWSVPQLAALDVPVIQAVVATSSSQQWRVSIAGLSPVDVASVVAIPEFDGRIIAPAFSFKEVVDDGDDLGAPVTAYRTIADRVERVAGIATRLARLAHTPPAARRVALVLSAYPTKRSRLGNAVALDTPTSVIRLLHALRDEGVRVDRIPPDGDSLMAELADHFTYDHEALDSAQLDAAPGRLSADAYREWFTTLSDDTRATLESHWGDAPGAVYRDGDELVFPGIDLGGVLIAVQPPRGFGENPVAVYHSPDLPPTHHYLGFYRWLDTVWQADAVVHVGKHGTLEWLPGKGVALSHDCFPDAALGDLPLFYPFVVNDPGEGTQAKRRAHAVVIDHLLPPMTRAETYGHLAQLEQLLDEHARIASLDPSKLPAVRAQVWDLLVDAEITRDLGLAGLPDEDAFDDVILEVDGYLCELKDAQIRGGLHIFGEAPTGDAEIDLVLAITRVPQAGVPALRPPSLDHRNRHDVDALEAANRITLVKLQQAGWTYAGDDPSLRWICDTLVPALHATPAEIGNLLHGLAGGYVPSGPSGAPTRGMAHVLPTGRNFWSVDPKAIPSPLAWDVGRNLADRLLERHVAEDGVYPSTVGLVIWGTATMRTAGDDVAEALALVGVRPVWEPLSGRVTGIELIPDDQLGRPRVDVTLRISGFFRDAFPHVVAFLDDAISLAGFGADGDPRIFGPKPGGYGSGILALLESRDWRGDDDLAAVYAAWSGFAYGRDRAGDAAPEAMRRRFAAIDVAVKNQDNREHDIFDSDDYLQEHGGMIAMVRSLTGSNPKAFFGDSSDPARPRVRSLAEEAARVVRTRVVNPKWIDAMQRHGYKGGFEMAATVDYLFGYDATAQVVEDWMYERVTDAYVGDPNVRAFFEQSNPWALRSIAERLLEANERGMWNASDLARKTLQDALLEAEGWEESR